MAPEPGQHTLLERIKWSSAQRWAKEKRVSYTDPHEHLGTFHMGGDVAGVITKSVAAGLCLCK